MEVYVIIAVILLSFLSFANGGNDVSKAIATLVGAKVTSVQKAVMWGVIWTMLGSVSGVFFGTAIIKNITENIYLKQPDFTLEMGLAIALAPALWVMLSSWRKWPVSTTHAIVGGLLGVGVFVLGLDAIAWNVTFSKIVLPLLLSPILAIAITYTLSSSLQSTARKIEKIRFCLTPSKNIMKVNARDNCATSELENCITCDDDSIEAGISKTVGISVDHLHWFSSGLLSFSRGLNDTPKLIAVILPFLLAGNLSDMPIHWMFFFATIAMAIGGITIGKRITEILGFKVTKLNHTQGFAANFVATFLVLTASRFGLPVSTTHVSASAIMGLGLSDGQGLNKPTVYSMLFAWLITVPVSAGFAYLIYIISGI